MITERLLVNQGHLHTFVISQAESGWDVCEEEDATVLHRVHRDDWHRVERDSWLFELRIGQLISDGWVERLPSSQDRLSARRPAARGMGRTRAAVA
jgi:hypothetical protein